METWNAYFKQKRRFPLPHPPNEPSKDDFGSQLAMKGEPL
jgi:hypothetical protein